ncbi:MAG: NAD(P)H-hydrate dehydratase [Lachnospiraceae bacterium]|nr:NAD(P)H-hydrate dehydratase [Lachnospiraceae bacterium]
MIDILSVDNMRMSDAHTIESGTSGRELMHRAAQGIYDSVSWNGPVGIVCGSGNNAGDGYALALILKKSGVPVTIIRLSDRMSEDGRFFYDRCIAEEIPAVSWSDKIDLTAYGTIVDCILGTGFKGAVRDDIARVINRINDAHDKGAYVVSADIGSGLNGDSGMGDKCVVSDLTVSIGSYKPGHFLNMAKDVTGKKVNVDIGIKPVSDKGLYHLIESSDVRDSIPVRKNLSNKGTYGYSALIGGSVRYTGAIRLASMANAAMRSGAGVVKIGLPGSLIHDVIPHILESTIFPMSDKDGEFVYSEEELADITRNVKTVAFGMGIGISDDTSKMLEYLLKNYKGRLIVDADGLTMLSRMDKRLVEEANCDLVLTPHIKEFSRLCGLGIDDILADPIRSAVKYLDGFEGDHRRVLLLKGPSTIITDGEEVYITDKGCPGMATAGSGDVLSGVLAATCAYIPDLMMAVAAGAYIAGYAGELAEQKMGAVSMTAGDTAAHIAYALQSLNGPGGRG